MDDHLNIKEIYPSVQGESTWAGVPMVFVRLAGCPLRCRWCDTEYAFTGGKRQSIAGILAALRAYPDMAVEVTGGEPLAQKNCLTLLKALCDEGRTVLLETAGSHDISGVDPRVRIVMDLKAPGSGESARNLWSNLELLAPAKDEIKFVLADRIDYEWALQQVEAHRIGERVHAILLSSVFGELAPQTLVDWFMTDVRRWPANARFQLQMHKFIWDPKAQSV